MRKNKGDELVTQFHRSAKNFSYLSVRIPDIKKLFLSSYKCQQYHKLQLYSENANKHYYITKWRYHSHFKTCSLKLPYV